MDGPSNFRTQKQPDQPYNLSINDLIVIQKYLYNALASPGIIFQTEKKDVASVSKKIEGIISYVKEAIQEKKTDKNNIVKSPDNILFNDIVLIKMLLERQYRLDLYKDEEKPVIDSIHAKLQKLLNDIVKKMQSR